MGTRLGLHGGPRSARSGLTNIAGATGFTFTPSGNITDASGDFVRGDTTLTFTPSGSLFGRGVMSGSTGITFTPSGNLADNAPVNVTGTTTLSFAITGDIFGRQTVSISGSTGFTFAITGDFASNAQAEAVTTSVNESDVQLKGVSIWVSLSNTTFVSGQAWIDVRQSIIDGLTSNINEAGCFTNVVRPLLRTPSIVRVSDTVMRIDIPAVAAYSVTQNETVTITLPAGATESGQELQVA